MSNSSEKGNQLEQAVYAIESTILKAFPAYQEKTFIIESKKVVVVDGVKHEIDIWVSIDLGKGYRSLFIFECKNWEDKVGKNEVIIFAEKLNAVQAQQGFFIAKSFTKDAKAQAKKNPRIELLLVEEHPVEQIPVSFDFHLVGREKMNAALQLVERGVGELDEPRVIQFDVANIRAKLNGEEVDFLNYMQQFAEATWDERLKTFSSAHLPEGVYPLEAVSKRHFQGEELVVNDIDVASIILKVEASVRITKPPVISHFDVATRGRATSLAPTELSKGASLRVTFVETS